MCWVTVVIDFVVVTIIFIANIHKIYGTHIAQCHEKLKWESEQTQVQSFIIIPHWLHYIRFIKIFSIVGIMTGTLHNEQLCLWTSLCECRFLRHANVHSRPNRPTNTINITIEYHSLWLFSVFSSKEKLKEHIIKWRMANGKKKHIMLIWLT